VVIDYRVRTEIRIRVASNRVIGAIELAYPRVVRRPAIRCSHCRPRFSPYRLEPRRRQFCSSGLPFHSLTQKKAKEKRTLVKSPGYAI
jgi:hypothetical protein